ncbi:hypothetical protein [Actinocatenispora rupis]|uniref:DinB superfamily protein n=1 Tax=Actinocatenispora rupis TaxID=519421 RepID=A0A8J3N7X7_9ACTN|nr:hypothetical protein [Actinocatenispora rupis]GID09531.1 hypothetical protein Aru02nite_04200 [Actinocatenispora rupis]
MTPVYVESGVAMATDDGAAAWSFEPGWWGRCGQGADEPAALAYLAAQLGRDDCVAVERIHGDEQAFRRDHRPASLAERAATLAVLATARADTIDLITHTPPEVLDAAQPHRVLPSWARWRTVRQMAWHLADTESRYYLPSLGLPARDPEPDLLAELRASARHVREVVATMPADLVRRADGEVWTTVKVLRRLAWHERSELRTMHHLTRRPTDA